MTETRTKLQPLPLRVNSRVRVRSILVLAEDSPSERRNQIKCLNATGTVVAWDPRWTLPCYVKLDNGDYRRFAKENLEVLTP